ncbi:AMP-binding protein [Roseiarcus sp.]|uniref:AMP-binding protein n=1 Tax=Roseiarcus sp. TaxID=1969460 RepID=UPI003D103717
MTLQLDQRAREAVIHGPPRKLMDGAAPTLMENIAQRVAEAPGGLIRSFQADGTLREETFADVWRRSGDIAARLRSLDVGPRSQTVLLLRDLLDFVPCFWASLRVGATPIPFTGVAHAATAEELKNLVARLERPAVIADAPTPDLDRLAALLPDAPMLRLSSLSGKGDEGEYQELDGDEPDIVCLLPTSGSTGTVKLVMLDRRAMLLRNFSQNYSTASLNANVMNVFPFEGISGLSAVFLRYASLTQLHPRILTARALAVFEAIERFAISRVYMTNSMAARLVEEAGSEASNFDLSLVKIVGLGGETVTRLVATRFAALLRRSGAGDVLLAGYGSTETGSMLAGADPSVCPLDEAGAPNLGGPAAGISIRIIGDDGSTLGEGEAGHVEAFAPHTLFAGYWKEPELSRDCMTADGWYKTGDLGAINDGGFSFRGRAKQVLVVGGRKFSLDEIDACLQSHADIGRQTVSFVFRDSADATDGLGVAVAIPEGEALDSVSTDAIRRALVRRYGLAPAVVTPVRSGEWPLTATGKVDRRALAERAAKAGVRLDGEIARRAPDSVDEDILASLWREALNLGRGFSPNDHKFSEVGDDFGRDDNFFDCGGESLRAAALLISVDKQFKRQFALREFFALPTFNNLLRLVEGASSAAADEQKTSAWPLPQDFRRHFLSYVEGWTGERVSVDRLMFGANRQGSLPPIFCVVNAEYEFANLAAALGPEQPVYAFRSLYFVPDCDEDLIQALALRYVKDLEQVHPDGPLFLLAHCDGCKIALPMAQHLLRRDREVPLLILLEWVTEPASYPGEVLLLYGRDSTYNPKFAAFNPEPAWRRMFGEVSRGEFDGEHDVFFQDTGSLAGELTQRCAEALDRTRPSTPLKECPFELSVAQTPRRAQPGARLRLEVRVKNVGKAPIGAEHANLRLGALWTSDGAIHGLRFIEAAPLPAIAPGAVSVISACVHVPEDKGNYELALDLFEERGRSLTGLGVGPARAKVKVTHRATRMHDFLRSCFRPEKQTVATGL